MSNPLRLAVLLFAWWLPGADAAANGPVRANVAAVAQTIEAHYHDAERGKQIAGQLRADAANGQFDALSDQRDLATALTARLKPLDRHFDVRWSPPPALPDAAPAMPQPRQPRADAERRSNHGVRRVEVLPGNVGYLDLRQFAHFEYGSSAAPARQAIDAALQLLAGTDALIIDLLDNGGGSPAMVGYLASAFTPRGADIYNTFHHRGGTHSEAPTDWYGEPRQQLPLYLLVSARTGSAAESFAYTLKNAGRAVVVGEASAGAANPGRTFDAGRGFQVFVSTGTPISPITRRNWEGEGVQPDVVAGPADALPVAHTLALEAALAGGLEGEDATETRWVLEALRAGAAPPQQMPLGDYVGDYGTLAIAVDDGQLLLRNGRRPPLHLLPLGNDLFAVRDRASPRVRFERGPDGHVAALQLSHPDGSASRYRRRQ